MARWLERHSPDAVRWRHGPYLFGKWQRDKPWIADDTADERLWCSEYCHTAHRDQLSQRVNGETVFGTRMWHVVLWAVGTTR